MRPAALRECRWEGNFAYRRANGVAFAGEVKLVRKATGHKKTDTQPSGSGFAGYVSRASRHESTVSATRRFL